MLTKYLGKKSVQQFLKFLFVGGSAFIIDFSVNLLVVNILDIELKNESAIANVVSYLVALTYNYTMSSRWSFKSEEGEKRGKETMFKFVGVNLFNLVWSSILIWYLVEVVKNTGILPNENWVQPVTKILVTSLTTITSFILYRTYVFKK